MFLLKVRKDRLEEYKRRHESYGRKCARRLAKPGGTTIVFLRDDGLLVGYLETPDFSQALKQMAEREVNARWQASMRPFSRNWKDAGRTRA